MSFSSVSLGSGNALFGCEVKVFIHAWRARSDNLAPILPGAVNLWLTNNHNFDLTVTSGDTHPNNSAFFQLRHLFFSLFTGKLKQKRTTSYQFTRKIKKVKYIYLTTVPKKLFLERNFFKLSKSLPFIITNWILFLAAKWLATGSKGQ